MGILGLDFLEVGMYGGRMVNSRGEMGSNKEAILGSFCALGSSMGACSTVVDSPGVLCSNLGAVPTVLGRSNALGSADFGVADSSNALGSVDFGIADSSGGLGSNFSAVPSADFQYMERQGESGSSRGAWVAMGTAPGANSDTVGASPTDGLLPFGEQRGSGTHPNFGLDTSGDRETLGVTLGGQELPATPPDRASQDFSSGGLDYSLQPRKKKHKSKVGLDEDESKVGILSSLFNSDEDVSRLVYAYRIPPTVLCRRAEPGEFADDDSSGDIVVYEEMLDAGLRLPMSSPICRILHYFSLTPGRLAPNGWRVLLGFLALWRRVHQEDASPVEFHAAYNLSETPTPNRGWYYFTTKIGTVLTGQRSNCSGWKSRFFFVGGEWAVEADRALVPIRWGAARKPGTLHLCFFSFLNIYMYVGSLYSCRYACAFSRPGAEVEGCQGLPFQGFRRSSSQGC